MTRKNLSAGKLVSVDQQDSLVETFYQFDKDSKGESFCSGVIWFLSL